MKTYLKEGDVIHTFFTSKVNFSGTVDTLILDVAATVKNCGNSPTLACGSGVATFLDNQRLTYDVYLEADTGKLWYDDEYGQ